MPDGLQRARLDHARGALDVAFTLCPSHALEARPEFVALALVNVRAAIRSLRAPTGTPSNVRLVELSGAPASAIEAALLREPSADFADSERDRRDLELLSSYCQQLLDASERPFVLARAARRRTLVRRFAPGLALAAALVGSGYWLAAPRLISQGKPWTTSSTAFVCDQQHTSCGGATTKLLFHTNFENNPWFELDLGKPYTVTGLALRNRSDCCEGRAVPLVAETSLDRASYRTLGRRFTEFTRWEPRFEPVRARYVRVRVLRPSILHLDEVLVYGRDRG